MKRRVNALKSCYYCDIFCFINIYFDIVINIFFISETIFMYRPVCDIIWEVSVGLFSNIIFIIMISFFMFSYIFAFEDAPLKISKLLIRSWTLRSDGI